MTPPPTVSYVCVLVAMILPFLLSVTARAGARKRDYVGSPRAFNEGLQGWHQRAHWAQLNAFENFPPFAVAVLTAWIAGASGPWLDGLALAFIVARILHAGFYLGDRPQLRSLSWQVGMMCTIGIFLLPVLL